MLAPCEYKLVGVEGSEIAMVGVATLDLSFGGVMVTADFIVTKSLHTGAILGLDFLEENGCIINTEQQVLHLQGKAIPLRGAQCLRKRVPVINAILADQLTMPPCSQIEIMATVGSNKHFVLENDLKSYKDWVVEHLDR